MFAMFLACITLAIQIELRRHLQSVVFKCCFSVMFNYLHFNKSALRNIFIVNPHTNIKCNANITTNCELSTAIIALIQIHHFIAVWVIVKIREL